LGELIAINYRAADLSKRHGAMLDFAVKMTNRPDEVVEADRQALRDAGFSERDIMDIACVAGFFNMTNRVSTALDGMPNREYHALGRLRLPGRVAHPGNAASAIRATRWSWRRPAPPGPSTVIP